MKAFAGTGKSAGRGEPDRRTGTEGGPAGPGDRFFAGMLAACRGAAEAASVDYPRLVYPYIEKEMKLATPIPHATSCASWPRSAGRASTAGRHGSRRGDADMDLRDEIQRIAAGVALLRLAADHARS